MELFPAPDPSKLVGLNDPIDIEWNERRGTTRPKSALHERRQQLKEVKLQYSKPEVIPMTIAPTLSKQTGVMSNHELSYEFVSAIDKFKEPSTRDSGIVQCAKLMEQYKDRAALQTILECLHQSSKKSLNPKTNTYNVLATDLELVTLAEAIKEYQEYVCYYGDKINQIAQRHLTSETESTTQAIAYVYMALYDKMGQCIEFIYNSLKGGLTNKATQQQTVRILALLCYYLQQQKQQTQLKYLVERIVEIFTRFLIDSLELLTCIEMCINEHLIPIDYGLVVSRCLRYCQQPINKSSIYYLVVTQACKLLEVLGRNTRDQKDNVIKELERLCNDRRVIVQVAARGALEQWRPQQPNGINAASNVEQCLSKVNYSQIPYLEYQKKGFASQMRASSFVRKRSGSPQVAKLQRKSPQPKIREKLQKIRQKSPEFQVLQEDTENERRKLTLQRLNSKIQNNDNLEDSLEPHKFIQTIEQQENEESIVVQNDELADSLNIKKQVNIRMPSVQHIEDLPALQRTLSENQDKETKPQEQIKTLLPKQTTKSDDKLSYEATKHQIEQNQKQSSKQQHSIRVNSQHSLQMDITSSPKQQNMSKPQDSIHPEQQLNELPIEIQQPMESQNTLIPKQQPELIQDASLEQEHRYVPIQQKAIKVGSQHISTQEEYDVDYNDDDGNVDQDQTALKFISQPLQMVDKFANKSFTFQKDIYQSQNNGIDQTEEPSDTSFQYVKIQQQPIKAAAQGMIIRQDSVASDIEQHDDIPIPVQTAKESITKNETISIPKQLTTQQQPNQLPAQPQSPQLPVINVAQPRISQHTHWQQAVNLINTGKVNEAFSLVFDNCDELYLIKLMILSGPCTTKLSGRNLQRLIQFMQQMTDSEILNIIGIGLVGSMKESNYFDELALPQLQEIKEVLYDMSGSENEHIGLQAANIYNEL